MTVQRIEESSGQHAYRGEQAVYGVAVARTGHRDLLGGPDPIGGTPVFGSPDGPRLVQLMGGPDPARRSSLMGTEDRAGFVALMGAPDSADRSSLMGGPDWASS